MTNESNLLEIFEKKTFSKKRLYIKGNWKNSVLGASTPLYPIPTGILFSFYLRLHK
jgi:hypothetical protein